jgi:hypothetical protein
MMVISLRSIAPRSMGSGFLCTATVTSLAAHLAARRAVLTTTAAAPAASM